MPWQNNGDGDKPNPWGNNGGGGPRRGGGGGEPPQIDDIIKKGQEQFKQAMPSGFGGIGLILLVAIAFWLASGLYRVEPNEQGVVLQFGKRTELTGPGLHWHLPYPVETVEVRGVTDEKQILIGSSVTSSRRSGRQTVAALDESLMLTQDENIVDVRFNVVWRIKDLGDYLFRLQDPEGTIKAVAESAMRELVGQNQIVPIITTARGQLEENALQMIQRTLDEYSAGVTVLRVQIIESEAPDEVKDAFLDVQRAEADQQRARNVATKYANEVIPQAQGKAEQLLQGAEAYRAQTVARAEGEAARFLSVYNEYIRAKDVTKKRIYLEAMEEILAGMDKVILDSKGGAVPYLPLNELTKKGGKE
ncbi:MULTISPECIES: FtsH protease activity modulator HflK [Kordiimonas]|uniref:FtsH protease activity modulator HflK n=1 Tax=Kordiimonas TaxID=288021 RepID=UPI001FF4CCD3|nr:MULTISPECIES: FtsH protease activity modulator HflK [Kordiimonas]MCK0068525.1 FtsH protease activity modulator HflK [Kordiimonas laminariae]UTW57883.1 FtsH protease activity modulator HflK [Kordiimonas sp. SCSIO 12603]